MIIILETDKDLELYRRDVFPADVKVYNITYYSEYSKRYVRYEIDGACMDCYATELAHPVEV